jgi:hypothetical protein
MMDLHEALTQLVKRGTDLSWDFSFDQYTQEELLPVIERYLEHEASNGSVRNGPASVGEAGGDRQTVLSEVRLGSSQQSLDAVVHPDGLRPQQPPPVPAQTEHTRPVGTETYRTGTHQVLHGVHDEHLCRGQHCTIHNPSHHPMRDFPTHWREDRYLMERICPHGIGHPDPDHINNLPESRRAMEAAHGCDGCCRGSDFQI